ncbi:O-antigen polysaccharide polymerase Wzy [Pseudomonas oryzihabitans]|uniref:O-antigen polysaccharide polymerase Wzy n=1 Tax=Pseudomonas oryzihabitans TaxID=47885 RepID=UPI002894C40D|nr:O-antigen polysaccharide polymerase Wzy [Pseudomonas oryzihabitans]MDT3719477.1 O-antigen polysaccharide polymerase Wzy [Pseudomonas oryzihabitans]
MRECRAIGRLRGRKVYPQNFDCFSAGFFFLVIWCAGVLVPLYPFLMGFDGFTAFWEFKYSDKESSLINALVLYSFTLILVLIGTYVGRKTQIDLPSQTRFIVSPRIFLQRTAIFTLVAASAFLVILFVIGGVSGLIQGASDRIRAFAGLNGLFLLQNLLLSVSLAWYIRLTRSSESIFFERCLFWGYFVGALMICALQGQKSTLFISLLSLIVVRHYRVKRINLARAALLGFVMFVSLMIYHVFKQEYLATGKFFFIKKDEGVFISFLSFMATQFTGNLMQLQTMTVLIDAMPERLPWQNGSTLLMIALILVPSAFFPGKPLTAAGVFTTAFWPNKWLMEGTTLPPGVFGEVYMNFGAVGVLLGGILLGIVWGRLYGAVMYNPQSDRALGTYALAVASMLHLFRGEFSSVLLLVASIWLPFLLLSSRREPPAPNPV